jgi:hypothetical protein
VRSFLYAATALTVDILWGYTGILTFGQAAFFGIGAYAAGIAFTYMDFSPQTAVLALVAGLTLSAIVAGVTGWISFFHGASPLYVAIVTLALPIILVQVLYSGGTFTGSSSGLVGYNTFDLSVEAWFTICGIGLVVLTTAAWFFVNSDFGRLLIAIRERAALHISRDQCAAGQNPADGGDGNDRLGRWLCIRRVYSGRRAGDWELRVRHRIGDVGSARRAWNVDRAGAWHDRYRPDQRLSVGNLPYVWKLIIGRSSWW